MRGTSSEIMSNKYANQQEMAVKRDEGSRLVTVYATMEADEAPEVVDSLSPVKTRGSSPKRKSVLSRNSKASPDGVSGSPPKVRHKHH